MNAFWQWWQHIPEHLDPVFLHLGPLAIRYYGLMYLLSFVVVYALLHWRLKHEKDTYDTPILDDLFTWAILGVIMGARLGYVLFYNLAYYLAHPLEIILPVQMAHGLQITGISGMSYHGGVIGLLVAGWLFCRRQGLRFWRLVDFVTPAAPLGYMFGRIGNFLNGELFGRVTTVAWGMVFPQAPDVGLRHPSQLYEAVFEGLVLFILLWSIRHRRLFDGFLFCCYLIGYGAVRFIIEFYRQPDPQLGFVLGPLSMGQLLCLTMIVIGFGLMGWFWQRNKAATH